MKTHSLTYILAFMALVIIAGSALASGLASQNVLAPPALVVPPALPASQVVDRLQSVSMSVATPSGGNRPYAYQWLEMDPGSSGFSNANMCSNPTSRTCSFTTSSSTTTGQYSFELMVTDHRGVVAYSSAASVTVNPVLVAGAISRPVGTIISGQSVTLGANPSGGTLPYVYQWYSGTSSSCTSDSPISGAVLSTYVASPTTSTYYCYRVTDSATTPVSAYSPTALIIVNPSTTTTSSTTTSTASTSSTTISSTSTSTSPTTSTSTESTTSTTMSTTTTPSTSTSTVPANSTTLETTIPTTSVESTTVSSTTESTTSAESTVISSTVESTTSPTTSIETLTTTIPATTTVENEGPAVSGGVVHESGGTGVVNGSLIGGPEPTFLAKPRPNGFYIVNVTTADLINATFDEKTFVILVHGIGPDSSSLEVDNASYDLLANSPKLIYTTATDLYYLEVLNISYASQGLTSSSTMELSLYKLPNTLQGNVLVLSSQAPALNLSISNTSQTLVNVFDVGTSLEMRAARNGTFAFSVKNITSDMGNLPDLPSGYTDSELTLLISANDVSKQNSVAINVTSEYGCDQNEIRNVPYLLSNNSWLQLGYSMNASACTMSYQIYNSGVVALMEVETSVNATTTVQNLPTSTPATSTPQASGGSGDWTSDVWSAVLNFLRGL